MSKSNPPDTENFPDLFAILCQKVFHQFHHPLQNLVVEKEGREYDARKFEINDLKIIYRQAKITPTKIGQFVTLWKRTGNGPIAPYHINDNFDFVIIAIRKNKQLGLFIFPKSVLITKGIVSTETKEGKRGFRVYPLWDITTNKQAQKTQEWQLKYFVDLNNENELGKIKNKLVKN